MEYLKLQWEYWGLQAPIFSWVVSAGLIVGCFLLLFYFWVRALLTGAGLKRARKKIQSLFGQNKLRAGEGLSLRLYDGLRIFFNSKPSLAHLWHKIDAHIIQKPGQGGGDEFWLAESIDTIFIETEVVETHYLKIAPGIITGIGLLATFMAILIALLDVKLVEDKVKGLDRIQGLGLLIQGLSGKFLSSVVALTCAVILLWFEKIVIHPAHAAFRAFVLLLKERLPRITPAQILSDLHKEISKQSTAFAIFNADLALTLRKSFGESVGPTLERMVQAIDDMTRFLRAAETKKQESMTDQLAGLLRNLEQSMQISLEKMGAQFNTSLTGSTQAQFEKVTGSLGETASLLKEMNTQFATNQTMLSDLISHAKSTTAEQLTMGQTQIQQLTGLLKGLMVQLQEKTGESIISVQQALAAITTDVSNKVSDLSRQMASIIQETSGTSTKAAKEIIDKAGTLSSRSAENLAKLLERHQC